jgi:predicted DCC family thiol-disulfide oxidoreductase YuxK
MSRQPRQQAWCDNHSCATRDERVHRVTHRAPAPAPKQAHYEFVQPVFLFDGDCGFCSACAAFVHRWIPTRALVVPWQLTDVAALELTPDECDAAVQWVDGDYRAAGPAAIAALLRDSRWYWRSVGRVLGLRRALAVGWPVYRWVSRNRHRMPGGTPACSRPAAHRYRSRTPAVTDRT